MNYYIQGSPARAEEIKAAFEAKGFIPRMAPMYYGSESVLFFTGTDNYIYETPSPWVMDIIKTHPDYKELELPVEFKDGDIIGFNDCTHNDGSYIDWVGIYKQGIETNQHLFHCVIPSCRSFRVGGMWRVFTAYPATKEQRDLLFKKMKEAGYEWDANKKELHKDIEPKFKIGDWLWHNTLGIHPILVKDYSEQQGYKVEGLGLTYYVPKGVVENEYHLWTMADAKDGDVLHHSCTASNGTFIFKCVNESGKIFCHCDYDSEDHFCLGEYHHIPHSPDSKFVHPATKEQRDLLFAKMREAGYEWDAEKKELRKIQPHYDIANFHAGMPVLVRDNNKEWRFVPFSHITNGSWKFNAVGTIWEQCIPFEGNEHLLGTTDMPSEEYINW